MRRMFLSLVVIAMLAQHARADEAAFRQVISAQISAFLADDLATAFTYASPAIQSVFGTPQRFGEMVRQGYPMVWRPAEVSFLSVTEAAGLPWQGVTIRDRAGTLHILEYQMIRAQDGWKINAVRLKKAPVGTV